MSKKCKKTDASLPTAITPMSKADKKSSKTTKSTLNDSKLAALIGTSNVQRWIYLRGKTSCSNNEDFVKFLLDLADNLNKSSSHCAIQDGNHDNNNDNGRPQEIPQEPSQNTTSGTTEEIIDIPTNKKKKEHKHKKRKQAKQEENAENLTSQPEKSSDTSNSPEILSPNSRKLKPSIMVNISNDLLAPLQVPQAVQQVNCTNKVSEASKVLLIENIVKTDLSPDKSNKNTLKNEEIEGISNKETQKKLKLKESEIDVRKAPELRVLQVENENLTNSSLTSTFNTSINLKSTSESTINASTNPNLCVSCELEHSNNEKCQLIQPKCIVSDRISFESYHQLTKSENDDDINKYDKENDEESKDKSYAVQSLPLGLKLDEIHQDQSNSSETQLGIFATQLFVAFTQFGPLIAPKIKDVDVPEDCTMKYIFEIIKSETERIHLNAENEEESNWIRFLRPALSREQRNLMVVHKGECLYFVTSRNVTKGEELVYWQDDVGGHKKKMEKTICGGCSMTFQHPLHYRIHCSVFHDVRYSLTIRKYHCKVCGAAVLGKENIMKHASELHNGQGAYQCQFCKKYFLRLNYLEMHRTYGCSANPHRSRPLCDFCGRKFCQPQKLKVHIKRMHSDMSIVLKEFQCKNCLKILGSRAALQRHFKEVHQKQMDGACACNKCGKTFQNKSNLKIHMLTHSGIKPFRCNQSTCAAAFTTKQCLQFHYKKVHGYTEEMMPKIERSVDYTFEAYSGNPDDEMADAIAENKTDLSPSSSTLVTSTTAADSSCENNPNTSLIEERKSDSPLLRTPTPLGHQNQSDQSDQSNSMNSPPIIDTYTPNMKILTKGSKKWIGEDQDIYDHQQSRKIEFTQNHDLQPDEHQTTTPSYDKSNVATTTASYESGKILGYNRHESNASLLVEAALDSVCSEPNIDIDVATTPCTESLVNNLYTLSNVNVHGVHDVHDVHDNDSLADVTYSQSVDVTDSRDINLISPSVNEQISVTDDIDELHHGQSIGIDYSSFHQEDFSPPNSPRNFRDYIQSSPQQQQGMQPNQHQHTTHSHVTHSHHSSHAQHNHNVYDKQISPGGVASPPRYDFGSAVVNPESDDSNNGIGVQNLSLHADKFSINSSSVDVSARDGIQLDLSIYKSHYSFDSSFLRKDNAKRFEIIDVTDHDHEDHHNHDDHKNYLIDNEDTNKFSLNGNVDNDNLDSELKDFEGMEDPDVDGDVNEDGKSDKDLDLSMRSSVPVPDLRSKFDLDLDLRKTYEMDGEIRRSYTDSLDDFRMKNYDLDNLDALRSNLERKTYESLIEDFRTDRNFEPLVLNPSELQGLDMSARGYHNYPNLNRYHHLYTEVDRPTVDLRLNYSPPPPPPAYTHPDILRVSLDLAQPSRHSVDLSLRSQIANSRLLTEHSLQTSRLGLDQSRLLPGDLTVAAPRHLPPDRLISDMSNRILSDHTTNRLLSNDQLAGQRLIGNEPRMLSDERLLEQPRLLEQNRLLGNGSMSPVSYSGYSVSPSPYHPTALPPRPHVTSPNPAPYHHYSAYY